jgi:hypothetical protein
VPPSAAPDKPWRGPWGWKEQASGAWRLHGANIDSALVVCHDGAVLGAHVTLRDGMARIRSLSSDPVPDPPREVWEMCGEAVPRGWRRCDGGWANSDHGRYYAPTHWIESKGRAHVDAFYAGRCVPPLPDEASAEGARGE